MRTASLPFRPGLALNFKLVGKKATTGWKGSNEVTCYHRIHTRSTQPNICDVQYLRFFQLATARPSMKKFFKAPWRSAKNNKSKNVVQVARNSKTVLPLTWPECSEGTKRGAMRDTGCSSQACFACSYPPPACYASLQLSVFCLWSWGISSLVPKLRPNYSSECNVGFCLPVGLCSAALGGMLEGCVLLLRNMLTASPLTLAMIGSVEARQNRLLHARFRLKERCTPRSNNNVAADAWLMLM